MWLRVTEMVIGPGRIYMEKVAFINNASLSHRSKNHILKRYEKEKNCEIRNIFKLNICGAQWCIFSCME